MKEKGSHIITVAVLMALMAYGFQGFCQQTEKTLDYYLWKPVEVPIATNNTLGSTPADIKNLVSSFDIDIRNSTYNILHMLLDVQMWDNIAKYSKNRNEKLNVFSYDVFYLIYSDKGVRRARQVHHNDCIRSVGLTRLNKGDFGNCWDDVWKMEVLDVLMKSPKLQNSLYEWVRPELRRVYHQFNSEQKDLFASTINHMIEYTSNYNHQKEKNFYKKCVSQEKEYNFVCEYRIVNDECDWDSEIVNPYRCLEAWVYRRVEEKTMTASQIKNWLVRIKQDLKI